MSDQHHTCRHGYSRGYCPTRENECNGNNPTTPDQQAEGESGLVERLREVDWSGKADGKPCDRGTTCWHRNPDGPEAADLIDALAVEIEQWKGTASAEAQAFESAQADNRELRKKLALAAGALEKIAAQESGLWASERASNALAALRQAGEG